MSLGRSKSCETTSHLEDLNRSPLRSFGDQVSFGGALGISTGYTIHEVGKAVLFLVGTQVVFLQYMEVREFPSSVRVYGVSIREYTRGERRSVAPLPTKHLHAAMQ